MTHTQHAIGRRGNQPGGRGGEDRHSDVVLLHGVGLDHHMWDRCLPALADRRVALPDLRGHGNSPVAGPRTTLADLAEDVAADLDRPSHLVGFSLGALVAQWLATTRHDLVRSLTLVSSVAGRSPAERAAVHRRLHRAATDFPASVHAAISRWFDPAWATREPELVEQVRQRLLSTDHDSYLHCYRVFADADAELEPLLGQISAPTLVVTGELDPGSTPQMAQRLAENIATTRAVVVVPHARHLLPLERPDQLTRPLLEMIEEVEHHERSPHL